MDSAALRRALRSLDNLLMQSLPWKIQKRRVATTVRVHSAQCLHHRAQRLHHHCTFKVDSKFT